MKSQSFVNDMKQLQNAREYIDGHFNDFFQNFFEFLDLLKKGIFQVSRFSKLTPILALERCLPGVSKILDEAKQADFKKEMIQPLTNCFLILLHTNNSCEIRKAAFSLFFKLVKIFGDNYMEFTNGFIDFLFDFSPLKLENDTLKKYPSEFTVEGLFDDHDKKAHFIESIKYFLDYTITLKNNQNLFLTFWNINQILIFKPLFQSKTVVKVPLDVCVIISKYINTIIQKQNLFTFILKKSKESIKCIIKMITFISAEYINDENNLFEQTLNIVQILLSKNIENIPKANLIKILFIIANIFKVSFNKKSKINDVSKLFTGCFCMLEQKYQELFLEKWRNNGDFWEIQLLILIFSVLINKQIKNKQIWEKFAKQSCNIKTLSSLGYFTSFYAFNLAPLLLKFNLSDISKSDQLVLPLKKWCLNHKMWGLETKFDFSDWINGNTKEFFKKYCKDLLNEADNILDIIIENIPNIDISGLTIQSALENVHAMIEAFDWKNIKNNESLQYKQYLIESSFYYTLEKLTEVLPSVMKYDESFLLKEFLNSSNFKYSVDSSNTNKVIVLNGLNLMGKIFCKKHTIKYLNDDILAFWYYTLDFWIRKNNNTDIKLCALNYAIRTLQLGFHGSNLLISTISTNMDISQINQMQSASSIVALNIISEIYEETSIDSVKFSKQSLQALIDKLNPNLKSQVLVTLLFEESINNHSENIDVYIQNLLFKFENKKNNEFINIISPITMILSFLEKTKNGTIHIILTSFLNFLELWVSDFNEIFISYVNFVIDLLIYSASIIDIKKYFIRFEEIANKWKLGQDDEISQQLLYSIMFLANNFLRFKISFSKSLKFGTEKSSTFGGTKDFIYNISNEQLSISNPNGIYVWKFKNIAEKSSKITLSDDINIHESLPKPDKYEKQISFESELNNYFNNLYDNQLKDFGIDDKLYKPNSENFKKFNFDSDLENKPQFNLPPFEFDYSSISFLKSLNFFDPVETDKLYPSLDEVIKIDFHEYRHKINVSLVQPSNSNSHFDDFKSGLGFYDKKENMIIYTDYRYEIYFLNNQIESVVIVWNEDLTKEKMIKTYQPSNIIRIEITPQRNGLFHVSIKINQNRVKNVQFINSVLVSKDILPIYILYCLISLSCLIEHELNEVQKPLLNAGKSIREIRKKQFYQHSIVLHCARTLLEKIN